MTSLPLYLRRHLSICDVVFLPVTSSFYLWQLPLYLRRHLSICDVIFLSVTTTSILATSPLYLWRHIFICDATFIFVTSPLFWWRNTCPIDEISLPLCLQIYPSQGTTWPVTSYFSCDVHVSNIDVMFPIVTSFFYLWMEEGGRSGQSWSRAEYRTLCSLYSKTVTTFRLLFSMWHNFLPLR